MKNLRLIYIPLVFFLIGGSIVAWGVYSVAVSLSSVLPLIMAEDVPDYNVSVRSSDIFRMVSVDDLPRSTLPRERLVVSPERLPAEGELYGVIHTEIPGIINARLFYGDSPRELNMGVGTYIGHPGAHIPGAGLTVLLAGHSNTVFSRIHELRIGDVIHIDTSYGRYRYMVAGTRVAKDTDTTAYDFTRVDENLILYTCYPFDSFGLTNDRFFVYADFLSGPKLDLVQTVIEPNKAYEVGGIIGVVEDNEADEVSEFIEVIEIDEDSDFSEAVFLDGSAIEFDIPVRIINDRTMVSYSDIAEAMGAEAYWDQSAQRVTMYLNNNYTIMYMNYSIIIYGEVSVDAEGIIVFESALEMVMDSPPVIINNSFLVPLRATTESLGATVDWDPRTSTASIVSVDS